MSAICRVGGLSFIHFERIVVRRNVAQRIVVVRRIVGEPADGWYLIQIWPQISHHSEWKMKECPLDGAIINILEGSVFYSKKFFCIWIKMYCSLFVSSENVNNNKKRNLFELWLGIFIYLFYLESFSWNLFSLWYLEDKFSFINVHTYMYSCPESLKSEALKTMNDMKNQIIL